MHHAAAQHDPLRGNHHDIAAKGLRDIVGLHFPHGGAVSQLLRLSPPAPLDGRTAGQPLQAVGVIGAHAPNHGVVRPAVHEDVSALRVEHPVVGPAVDDNPQTHAGPDGDIDAVRYRPGAAPHRFAQGRSVDVRINAHRNAQSFFKPAQYGVAPPVQLGRGLNGSIVRRAAVQIHRPEASDAHGGQPSSLEEVQKLRHGGFRNAGGNADPLENFSLGGADGAHHFRTSGLQRTKVRHIAITPSI